MRGAQAAGIRLGDLSGAQDCRAPGGAEGLEQAGVDVVKAAVAEDDDDVAGAGEFPGSGDDGTGVLLVKRLPPGAADVVHHARGVEALVLG